MKSKKAANSLLKFALMAVIIIVLNVLGSFIYGKIDLTEDQRFTLNPATAELLAKLPNDTASVSIEILLDGEFPSDFRHLQNNLKDLMGLFKERSAGMLNYRFVNPLDGTEEEVKALQKQLAKQKIMPLQIKDARQGRMILVFPFAIVRSGYNFEVINMIELGDGYYQPSDISASINSLEYKFAAAIKKLQLKSKPVVAFINNHGELPLRHIYGFEKALSENYGTKHVDLSRLNQIDSSVSLVVVAKPKRKFSYDDQFKLDQYVMNGGRILWMIDALDMEDDSLRKAEGFHVPMPRELDLQKLLFNYGVRVNNNLIASYDAAAFGGLQSGPNQKSNPKWFYYPLVKPFATPQERLETGKSVIDHPIVKNLDFVLTKYPSSIDTVGTKTNVKKTPLLRSSKYSKLQYPPTRIGFGVIDPAIGPEAFTKGSQNVAVLLEGEFESHFKNRLPPRAEEIWKKAGNYPIRMSSRPSKMIVISDGDIAYNNYHASSQRHYPLGAGFLPDFGPKLFANQEFLLACVEYLTDDSGLVNLRNREIRLRPLDQKRAFDQESLWQFINLGLPLIILGLFGLLYYYLRRRRYTK